MAHSRNAAGRRLLEPEPLPPALLRRLVGRQCPGPHRPGPQVAAAEHAVLHLLSLGLGWPMSRWVECKRSLAWRWHSPLQRQASVAAEFRVRPALHELLVCPPGALPASRAPMLRFDQKLGCLRKQGSKHTRNQSSARTRRKRNRPVQRHRFRLPEQTSVAEWRRS